MGKVISFMNMKGGVGKTTLCLSLGYHLAKYKEKKVLFIDLDPQFNLTQSLLNEYNLTDSYLEGDFKGKDIWIYVNTLDKNLSFSGGFPPPLTNHS